MVAKTAISMREDIYDYGLKKAQRLFQGNFSAYVCYLISKDREGVAEPRIREKDINITAAIDEILDI